MNYKVELAKNKEYTLKVNDYYIYSKYNPRNDSERFILKEYDESVEGYFLIGLGLGYHLEALLKLTSKPVLVFMLDNIELTLFKRFSENQKIISAENVKIISVIDTEVELQKFQIIVPLSWMKAVGTGHRLYNVLEDIKIRQMSYKTYGRILEENFNENIKNNDKTISIVKNAFKAKTACLISAGPSLDEVIDVLKKIKDKSFILSVGSALKLLLRHNIVPDAVIITDGQPNVIRQLKDSEYVGDLFYLATANHEMVKVHKGERIIIFQEGYGLSEQAALQVSVEILETGGSVATTGLSLLEYMGFDNIILFGQDLGFKGNQTHSVESTSGKKIADNFSFRKVLANSGEYINTTNNLNTYHRWFEQKAKRTSMKILNTSWNGAKIQGIPYIDSKVILMFLDNNMIQEISE